MISEIARCTLNVVHPSATVRLTRLVASDLRQCLTTWPLIPPDTDTAEFRDDEDGGVNQRDPSLQGGLEAS
jgi:hypothetical protein